MNLPITIRLVWTFSKGYVLASLIVTLCCLFLFWEFGPGIFIALFWLKAVTMTMTFFLVNNYKKREYYYYQNLGISKVALWVISLSFDFILFVFLILQTNKFR
jgi:hypothetical protein